jgi:transglutaminase-like putative cysteine protease
MSSPATNDPAKRAHSGCTWADICVLLALTILGVIGFEPSFGGFGFLIAGLAGTVLGGATGVLTARFRLGLVPTVLSAVAGYFLFGSAAAVQGQALFGVLPTLQSLVSLSVGAVYGWADIVTLTTPIGAPQYIAVVPFFATWLVALVSTTLAARWLTVRSRTAWRLAITLIGPLAVYLGGILIGTDTPYQAGIRGVSFAVLALIWVGWRRPNSAAIAQSGQARLRSRKIAGIAVIVAGATLAGSGAGLWLAPPQDQRFVLRDEIEPPFDPLQYPSPLSGFRHYTKQVTDDVLFTVSGLRPGDTIRLATLDSYTGKLWNVTGPESSTDGSGSFSLVGRELPDPSFITPDSRSNVVFTMKDYDDVWMPSVGYPTELDFTAGEAANESDNLRYNLATGTAVLTSGLAEGDQYSMQAVVQKVVSPADLSETAIAAVELTPVSASPDVVASKAQEFAGNTTSPIAQLEAIRLALAEQGYLSHGRASDTVRSRAGHGADRISDLLERNQMVGDQEQYASAFALMARSFGFPARVVMGFAPEIPEDGSAVEVVGDDVTAWVEVAFDKVGWVVFNPTPDETDIPQDQTPKPQSEPQPQVRQPPRADSEDEDLLTPVELEKSEEEDDGLGIEIPGWVFVVALSLLIPAMIIFVPVLIVAALKARRARRRRSAAAAHDRIAGAWAEVVDQYSELGFEVPQRATRLMVAERLEQQLLAPDEEPDSPVGVRAIAENTDDAVFSGQEIDPERSDEAWRNSLAVIERAKSGLSRSRLILARYRVRAARDWAARISTKQGRAGEGLR